MYEHVMVETLSGTFNAMSGDNVYNLTLHVYLPPSEGQHLLFCVLYNVVLENHSVQNPSWGRGSIASSRPNMLVTLCESRHVISSNVAL